jgi:acetyl esterase/lipase
MLADHEGHTIALWLNRLGVTAVVLRYRLGPRYHYPAQLQDVARAVRTVRLRAKEWGIDPNRIGIMGFSAGGHLASTIATHFDAGDSSAKDPVERVSSRPDIAVLAYPVISMVDGITHQGSRRNLLGDTPSQDLVAELSNEKHVTPHTPPTFIFHTADDPVVPVENSLLFAEALRAAHVPYELHVFEHGPHGVGLASDDPVLNTWTMLLQHWLKARGFVQF